MLIRQKAGWRLHHQAYLWPRRSRASAALPSLPASLLLLPRRRRSGASSGSSAAQSGDDSSSSPSSLRRSSSCSSGLEGEETWPPSPASFFSSRSRKDSNGLDNSPSSSSSSVASSFGPISSPRKKRTTGFAGLVSGQTQPASIFSGPFTRRSRRISSSSDPSLDEGPSQFPSKPGRRSSGGPSVGDGAMGWAGLSAAADARRTSSRASVAAVVAPAGQTSGSDGQHVETGGHGRSESAVRTRRDARSADSKLTESSPSCNGDLTCYSSLKGSSNNNNNNINNNNNNNNNNGPNCSSQHALSSKGGNAHEDSCLNGLSKSCWSATTARMGVQCPEKPSEKFSCGGAPTDSPMQANLPPFAPSPLANCSQDNTTSRKQTAEISVSGGPAIRRRAQRQQSVSSASVQLENAMTSESYRLDLTDISGHQNGFHAEGGLNGMRASENLEKSIKSICCFTIEGRSGCTKCPPSRLNGATTTLVPSSFFASTYQQTAPVSNPSHGARSRSNSHGNANSGTAPALPSQVQTPAFDIGSKPVSSESNRAKHPQHSSSLSSSAVPASSQQQSIYQLSQGSQSISLGSNSSSIDDKTGAVSSSSLSARSASASSKATVLNQRQRSHSGNSAQKSQPSSTETSTLTSSRFKTSPSSTTLAAEPASPPPQPSKARCKWRGCSCELDASDLLEHVRKHVEAQIEKKTYACLWSDCKVFNKPSWSCSWLERHIVTHSGHRPFKCILDNCGQRFHTQAALERHVNGHFTVNSQNGIKSGRGRDDISLRAQQKRRRQLKRRYIQTVKTNDFIDEHTMTVVRHELHSLAAYTHLDLAGIALHTTFRTLIVGRRSTESGSKHSLLEFVPSDVLENKWVPEKDAQEMSEISIPMSRLPADTVTNLHDNLYRQHRFRKHKRK